MRKICETFYRPFDSQEVYNAQEDLTRTEVDEELARAAGSGGYLTISEPYSGHTRTKYVYRDECRSYGPVTFAMARRTCADCGETIEAGDAVFNPKRKLNGNDRSKWLCRTCGFKALAAEYERLKSMR